MQQKTYKDYIAPAVQVTAVCIEQGIAASLYGPDGEAGIYINEDDFDW